MKELNDEAPKKVLIIGIAGGLALILSRLILKKHPHWQVMGIDSRPVPKNFQVDGLEVKQIRYSRGNFENLFRENQFDYVYHLARISHSANLNRDLNERLELHVMGTNRILDLGHRFNVKKICILSTFHVYGASHDNGIFLSEEAPLKASIKHSDLRDVVEMDQMCTTWMWKYQNDVSCVVLRPCNVIGAQINNTMTKYLRSSLALKPIDYNPVFQFIHEFDMANVLYRAIKELPTGVYNVAPNDFIALREALKIVRPSKGIPFPMFLASGLNQVLKIPGMQFPEYLIDYLKYSCLIDNSQLVKHLGSDFCRFKIDESLKLIS